jgi:drug/metabolite transporter (DMT)-like permease
MIYLVLTIIVNVAIFLSFRSYTKLGINTFNAIVFNYLVCVLTGLIFIGKELPNHFTIFSETWILFPIGLGILFVLSFYIIALTTQNFNITVAAISSKMSMVIPVIFSLYIFKLDVSRFNTINFIGLLMALASIVLCSIKSEDKKIRTRSKYLFLIPILVFLATGAIDTSLNYINAFLIHSSQKSIMPIFIFAAAFFGGLIVIIFRKSHIKTKDILGGIYLGIPNYFSIYFLLQTLSYFKNNGAVVYPILNVGIIVISSMSAFLIFRERLNKSNITGMIFAITAIFLISYQDIISYFS